MRRVILFILTLLALFAWSLAFTEMAQAKKSHRRMPPASTGFVPWPNHTEWTEFTIPDEGSKLCRAAGAPDSLGSIPLECMDLPAGTEIYVPHVVPGEAPEVKQEQRWRKS